MKVLAYRSNKIFFTAPILVPLCFIVFSYMLRRMLSTPIHSDFFWYVFATVGFTMISQLAGFVERLFMPKVLIECDNCGVYIYKYKRSEPILLRYEHIWDCRAQTNEGAEDIPLNMNYNPNAADSYERAGITTTPLVGMLKFNTPYEVIRVHGIKDVKAVERELASIRYDFKDKQDDWIDYNIEYSRRQKELEELEKHDINT